MQSTADAESQGTNHGAHTEPDGAHPGLLSRWMIRLGKALIAAGEKGGLGALLWRFFRRLTLVLSVIYILFISALWAGTAGVGERNITTAFLLFIPPSVWFLPLVVLLPLALVFHRGCFLAQVFAGLLLLWGWLGFNLGGGRAGGTPRSDDELTLMTYNRGQHMNQSLQPFKNATRPDLLLFQDAWDRAAGFRQAPGYAEFGHAVSVGEFTLLSRFPIMENALLPAWPSPQDCRAARFVIDWKGQPVSIYAVHLMTPRDELNANMRGGFLWGVLGLPGTRWAEKRRQRQAFWDGQLKDAETLLKAMREDPHPCIAAGDFNSPSTGCIHRLLCREMGDAHAAAGEGCGFTFPGVTRNPLSLFGPWLRIDYVFYDRHWQAVACETEIERPSQHRAVTATLRREPGSARR
ncbi:endonuclease/exonuclease/phosphatase family protein [Prosthecobacter sp.]|uniref:endonuclease/exonuclease/phosphatase family protein n=1 Tax=Prosthecobacter sp. TaxID=1965333 RepID=UPI003783F806